MAFNIATKLILIFTKSSTKIIPLYNGCQQMKKTKIDINKWFNILKESNEVSILGIIESFLKYSCNVLWEPLKVVNYIIS